MDRVLSRSKIFFPLLVLSCPFSLTPSLFPRPLSISRSGGHRVGDQRRVAGSLSLHYDVKRGDGGGATAGRGPRLFSPEATEAVEWVLHHFFPLNQPQYRLVVVTTKHASAPAIEPVGPGTSIGSLLYVPVVDLIHSLCATRRDTTQVARTVLFMDADASKEEEGATHVVDHARDLCAWARVDDTEFEAV
jgi:hypothetical protein